jgi:hypothetical protein
MYAKLVVGNANIHHVGAMRDIGRLLVSSNPSTANLLYFSNTSSVIVSNTPAGWTYVGSNVANDQPTISTESVASPTRTTGHSLVFSAPCLDNSKTKYLVLGNYVGNAVSTNAFSMMACSSSTNLGVMTNRTPASNTVGTLTSPSPRMIPTISGTVIHLLATARHCTLIVEGIGYHGLWESSQTSVHDFYNVAPFIIINNPNNSATVIETITTDGTAMQQQGYAVNVTNPSTGTNYGVYNIYSGSAQNKAYNQNNLFWVSGNAVRENTIDSSGNPRYQIDPVWYKMGDISFPASFVTGVCPIYWTKGGIGSTGDTVNVNGDTYTFFNAGTSTNMPGLLIKVE